MRTTDPTNNSVVTVPTRGFARRFAPAYRWIMSVLTGVILQRAKRTPSNDLSNLNAHQLRDLGLDHRDPMFREEQERQRQARLAAYAFLTGMSGR
ncbi:hypothetical protein [Allorhizobium taibaishanense]|uniref:Uncharacterized protein YjiS (DUF1127 family) n=1 Tax=Allorhizobium taibaishanense TaxID=887144 RepID=A0A1Q8ZZI9_9HYPH|nr:hypothetical protein [Allorhizobium taibaishanense]MBB4007383.1 uncharacterized protein YjiS (DUF1127 family) [Allorhizobium taibaishanense]OLP47648.1 hypothetical protein BJF91_04450 [Allorhizobium taibaishanense]